MGEAGASESAGLTQQDLDYVPDDGNRCEVIDGVLCVTPFPSYPHQNAQSELLRILGEHVKARRLGRVFSAGLKVVLDEPTRVGPDVVHVVAARMDRMRLDGYYGAPDLLVETLSSKPQLDRAVKLNAYARAGVAHYGIIDPAARSMDVYRLQGQRHHLVAQLAGDLPPGPELFPGLTFPRGKLWVEPGSSTTAPQRRWCNGRAVGGQWITPAPRRPRGGETTSIA
jgi:Uma2 family endonuclease